MHPEQVEVNGREPDVVGSACERLVVVEYYHAGRLVEPANVVFLRFGGRWHRLHIDHETVFWRPDSNGPQGFTAEELDATFRPVEVGETLGVQGQILEQIRYVPLADGAGVHLFFANGRSLRFESRHDVTTYSS